MKITGWVLRYVQIDSPTKVEKDFEDCLMEEMEVYMENAGENAAILALEIFKVHG